MLIKEPVIPLACSMFTGKIFRAQRERLKIFFVLSAPVSLEPWAHFTALLCAFVCVCIMLGDLQNSFLAAQALYLLLWVTEKEREGGETAGK